MLESCLDSLENVFNSRSVNGCVFMSGVTLLNKSFAWLFLIGSIIELHCWKWKVGASAHQECHFLNEKAEETDRKVVVSEP